MGRCGSADIRQQIPIQRQGVAGNRSGQSPGLRCTNVRCEPGPLVRAGPGVSIRKSVCFLLQQSCAFYRSGWETNICLVRRKGEDVRMETIHG